MSFQKFTKKTKEDFAKLVEENKPKYRKGDKLFCKKTSKLIVGSNGQINFIKNKTYLIEDIIHSS